jgi:small subunit ribosomal protein S20
MLSGEDESTNKDVPIKKSAKKYMRVTDRKTIRNKKVKGVFRNAVKETKENVAAGKVQEAQELLKKAIKALDKAAQKKVIKKNTAARKKSRLNAAVKKLALKK